MSVIGNESAIENVLVLVTVSGIVNGNMRESVDASGIEIVNAQAVAFAFAIEIDRKRRKNGRGHLV